MGKEKTTTETTVNQTSTPTPTAEQTRLNQLDLQLREQNQGALGAVQGNSLNLANLLLQGQSLPGYLQGLPGGISPDTTQSIVDESLRDIQPSFQQGGLLDSGVRASVSGRVAGDVRRNSAEFNVNNLLQLLNLATGSSAQVQQPILGQSATLGQRLAGLNSMNQTGNTISNFRSNQNPFLNSFAQGSGQATGAFMFCWVAAEVFEEGWEDIRTYKVRNFFKNIAPKWLLSLYIKFGERIAKFISNKPILKKMIKPLFEYFSRLGE